MSYYEMSAVAVLQMIGEVVPILCTIVRPPSPVSVSSKFGFQNDAPRLAMRQRVDATEGVCRCALAVPRCMPVLH